MPGRFPFRPSNMRGVPLCRIAANRSEMLGIPRRFDLISIASAECARPDNTAARLSIARRAYSTRLPSALSKHASNMDFVANTLTASSSAHESTARRTGF